jgi:NDP-sugar pyrophosphorylase family protein
MRGVRGVSGREPPMRGVRGGSVGHEPRRYPIGVSIYALDDDVPEIDEQAYIAPEAVIIGRVKIGPQASVWPGAVLRGDHGTIIIGARTSIQDGTIVHCTERWSTIIGDDCVVGHNAHLEGCVIEPGCLIGSGSVTLNRALWWPRVFRCRPGRSSRACPLRSSGPAWTPPGPRARSRPTSSPAAITAKGSAGSGNRDRGECSRPHRVVPCA